MYGVVGPTDTWRLQMQNKLRQTSCLLSFVSSIGWRRQRRLLAPPVLLVVRRRLDHVGGEPHLLPWPVSFTTCRSKRNRTRLPLTSRSANRGRTRSRSKKHKGGEDWIPISDSSFLMKSEARRRWTWRATSAMLPETATTATSPMQLELSIFFFLWLRLFLISSALPVSSASERMEEECGGIWIREGEETRKRRVGNGKAWAKFRRKRPIHLVFDEFSVDFSSPKQKIAFPTNLRTHRTCHWSQRWGPQMHPATGRVRIRVRVQNRGLTELTCTIWLKCPRMTWPKLTPSKTGR